MKKLFAILTVMLLWGQVVARDNEPDFNGDLQDADHAENQKRYHHFAASACKGIDDRCGKDRCRGCL